MSLSKDEFREICYTIAGPKTTIDKGTLYSAICCAGKSVIRAHLDNLWPSDKKEIDHNHAYRIFERLEDLVVDESDMEKIREQGIRVTVDQVLNHVAEDRRESIRSCLAPFTKDGYIELEEFIQAVQTTKHETLALLLRLQQPCGSTTVDVEGTGTGETSAKKAELQQKPTFRGVLFTNPLRVVKHVLDGEGPCRITLKVEWNSDMGTNEFVNDVFGMVMDSSGRAVAVTSRLLNENYQTDEFRLEPGFTVIVMGLGTNTKITSKKKQRAELTSQDRLSKRFKMSLMNIFDMFDFDCDGLLSRNEYAAFTIATADTPPDDEACTISF
ncbi:hypothetical protein RB195_020064 [Necator americanus]|uniref:EF-hand domain-containing protein n=1 Tax=Necator americanus TaxID=51031 RepID=A0ABR1CH19_NECAM